MTHATITPAQLAAPDVVTALTEYRFNFIDALGKYSMPKDVALGLQDTSSALEVNYPMSVGDPVFQKLVGDAPVYQSLSEIMLTFSTDVFQSGVKEKATRLRSAEWARLGWGKWPTKNAVALFLMYSRLLATAMMSGESTASPENAKGLSAIKIFQRNHPCDPSGGNSVKYDNLFTGAADGAYPGAIPFNAAGIKTVRKIFRTQKGQNGTDYRNIDLTHVVVGPDLEEAALTYFKDDLILEESGAGNTKTQTLRPNPQKKYKPVEVLVNPYLTEEGVWYPVAADETGEAPWITLTKVPADSGRVAGMPGPALVTGEGIEWIVDDENSETYKHGSKVGPAGTVAIAAKVEAGSAITLPWRILRCKAT